MIQPSRIARDFYAHEDAFLARYAKLRSWALQLTENDRERAEDLVHDAYIQFTFARPDLNAIGNLNGYLYTMLRNLHLSQVRRSLRGQYRTISIVDYDSAEIGLRTADPGRRFALQDQLREVCRYACMRKETSKAGSVLILRFLHGYYPREIAQVMQCTRAAVEERLRVARREARQYLENPNSLHFLGETDNEKIPVAGSGFARTVDEFLNELRRTIFDSRRGVCPAGEQLELLYRAGSSPGMNHATLGHLVSCPTCLDQVNRLLNLPLLAERFPTDTLGTDSQPKDGGGGDNSGGSTGGASDVELRKCRKAARDVLEHRPAELCVSVNGHLMAAQTVGAELNEQSVSISMAENVEFVEIFSEQDLRLLFLSIAKNDKAQREARVELSDDRTLEAMLSFGEPWPTLQVTYRDPSLAAEASPNLEQARAPLEVMSSPRAEQPAGVIRELIEKLGRWPAGLGFLLRPGSITAALSLILIGVLLFVRLHIPVVSAAELLRRSILAEEVTAGEVGTVLHRTINIEERRLDGSDSTVRRRVEIWQSAARGLKLRRFYDEQNHLVGGEWSKPDGTSTLYRRGMQPQSRTAPEGAAKAIIENGELWRLDASAATFQMLIDPTDTVRVDEDANAYVVAYERDTAQRPNGLLSASLTLNRTDLHATEQKFIVSRQGELREYRFSEAGFEKKPTSAVHDDLFVPEPELLTPAAKGPAGNNGRLDADPKSMAERSSEAVASLELEIEVTYLLNRIKADLGEQVNLSRTAGGMLRIEALAENDARKDEILKALGPVRNNPAVKVEVSTVAEALKRQRDRSDKTAIREVEVENNRIPADAELRAYFTARLTGREAIDEEITRYTNRVMSRSRQALLHASALKKLIARFSPAEINELEPKAQATWLAMIREHAIGYQHELAALKQDLRPIFNGPEDAPAETVNEKNLAQSAARLVELSYANDEAVRAAFTISAERKDAASIKSRQFWRSLSSAERLAAAMQHVYQR
jgi:RNA polymerase sigma factor (sigma-70 family)